jgi:DNA mismatch repair protein MutS2
MPFNPGDVVQVSALGKAVVREVRPRGRYLVELKGRSVLVAENQLSALASGKRRAAPPPFAGALEMTSGNSPGRPGAATSIDLHGMTVEEAVAALDAFLNDAILASLEEVRVIHGRSGGRLRQAVHVRLRQIGPVAGFRLDPRNQGVTIVTL